MKSKFSTRNSQLSTLIGIIIVLMGCTSDDPVDGTNPLSGTAIEVSAGIGSSSTRATDASWHAGDAIGIYLYQTGTNNPSNNMVNRRYVNATAGTSATFQPDGSANTAYYPGGEALVDVVAYYPQRESIGANALIPVDVTDQSNLASIDLMTSNRSNEHSSADDRRAVSLRFAHRLAKISLDLKSDPSTADLDLSTARVTLSGTSLTATYDLTRQELVDRSTAADLSLIMAGATAKAIVIPTTPGDPAPEFTVTIGDETFTATMPEGKTFSAGKEAIITIRLERGQPSIEAEIIDWVTGTEAELPTLRIDIPAFTNDGNLTSFDIWLTAEPTDIRSYTWDGTSWTSPNPFYDENLAVGEEFEATTIYNNYTDPVTELQDVLTTGTVALDNNLTLTLNFKHSNALLNLSLARGNGFDPEGILKLENATVKILAYSQEFTGSTEYQLIVEPGTVIKQGDLIAEIKLDGRTYHARAEADITLEAAKAGNITTAIMPSSTETGISVIFTDWQTGYTGTGQAVNIYTPQFENESVATTINITKVGGTVSHIYAWSGSAWTTDTPLYVESYEAGDKFIATTNIGTDPFTGVELDLVSGETQITDNALNLNFAHKNARMKLVLSHGARFPVIDLNQAKVTLTDYPGKTLTGSTEYSLVVPPVPLPAGKKLGEVEIVVGGATQQYQILVSGEVSMQAALTSTINVALTPTAPGISVTYTDWESLVQADMTVVNIDVPNYENAPLMQSIVITKNGDDAAKISYQWEGNIWKQTGGPVLYVEDITNSDSFTATATGAADPITDVTDDGVVNTPVKMVNDALTFNFTRTKSLIAIQLESKPGLHTDADLKSAEVVFKYRMDGATQRGNRYYEYTVEPGSIIEGELIATIKVKGITYEVKADNTLNIQANNGIKFTVTLATEVGITATVGDWESITDTSGNIIATDVTTGIDLSSLPGNGKVTITATTPSGDKTAEYRYQNSTLVLADGSDPIYWEDFPRFQPGSSTPGVYTFRFRFEPDAVTGITNDILIETVNTTWGEQIKFNNLQHLNAQIIVQLVRGNYAHADWDLATLSLTGFTEKDPCTLEKESGDSNTDLITKPVVVTANATTGGKYVNLVLNDINYKVEISNLTVGGINLATLEGGKSYTLKLILNKTEIGIGNVTIGDFIEVEAGGSITYGR